MYKELGLSETDGVLAAYNAVCELVEDTERLQTACAAKEAELAELRGQTSELFGARLEAEGMGVEAVTAAKAMWQRDPQSVAMATLGCDFAEAANPYGCNQYGHGFKEPHSGYGSGGQKTFDFFGETQKEVNKDRRKAQRAYDSATKDTEKALERVKETADAVERFANSPDDKTKSMDELISEADKLKEANKQAIKDAKAARRRQLEAAREAGKKVKPAFNGNKNGNIDDELYDEYKDVFDDDEVKSSRTLEELLEEEDIVNAANPYGCNQYGHRKGHNGGQSGSEGESKNRTNDNKKATLTDTEAESLTDDMFEIAMEEGGYEKLYDVPKEKLKAVIKKELMKSGSRDMFGNYETGEDGNPAKYRWWRKNVKRIVDSLDDDVKSSRTLEELLEEEEIVKSSHYDGYEIDEEVDAANPYGCNQYGHEWRGKHGEGWKPSGRGGESGKQKGGDNEKKAETPEERTKRVVVGAIKDAKSVLDELKKQIGNPPYNANDPLARAKVDLEHELTRTQERDTEEAAERLKKVTEGAQEALKQGEKKDASTEKTVEEEVFDLDADMKKFFAADSDSRRAMNRKWMDDYKDARDRISDLAKNKNIDEETRNKEIEKWKDVANKNSKRIIKLTEIVKERERQRINNDPNNSKNAEKITKNFDSQLESVKRLYPEL